jgi:hypothetical protein
LLGKFTKRKRKKNNSTYNNDKSMFMGYFMAALDTTILITTLGKITSEFGSIERIGWVSHSTFSFYLGVLKKKEK